MRDEEIKKLIESVPMVESSGWPGERSVSDVERLAVALARLQGVAGLGSSAAWASGEQRDYWIKKAQIEIAKAPREQITLPLGVRSDPPEPCACCNAPRGEKHLIGCRYGEPTTPGRLTNRITCKACGTVGFASNPLPHAPKCPGVNGSQVEVMEDTCAWRVSGEAGNGFGSCGAVAVQVRRRTLVCAKHAAEFDRADDAATAATEGVKLTQEDAKPSPDASEPDEVPTKAKAAEMIEASAATLVLRLLDVANEAVRRARAAQIAIPPSEPNATGEHLRIAAAAGKMAEDAARILWRKL